MGNFKVKNKKIKIVGNGSERVKRISYEQNGILRQRTIPIPTANILNYECNGECHIESKSLCDVCIDKFLSVN